VCYIIRSFLINIQNFWQLQYVKYLEIKITSKVCTSSFLHIISDLNRPWPKHSFAFGNLYKFDNKDILDFYININLMASQVHVQYPFLCNIKLLSDCVTSLVECRSLLIIMLFCLVYRVDKNKGSLGGVYYSFIIFSSMHS